MEENYDNECLNQFVSSGIDKFIAELIEYGIKEKLKNGELTKSEYNKLNDFIRTDEFISSANKKSGHPDCVYVKMGFPNGTEFICFGKNAEKHEIEKEKVISDYLGEQLNNKIVLSNIYNNSEFIAFELLDKEDIDLAKKVFQMSYEEKENTLEKIIDNIVAYHSIPLNKRIKKLIEKSDYWKEYESFGFTQKFDYKNISDKLNANRSGLTHGDLHFSNIILKKNGDLWIIDWSRAMYGVPQTDLARIIFSFGWENNAEKENKAIEMLYSKLSINQNFEKFKEIYSLARIHEYIKLAGFAEKKAKEYREVMNDKKFLAKNKYDPKIFEVAARKAEHAKEDLLTNVKNYAKIKEIKI
ncbi:MAG: phosphotransferase [Candidatus Pacearchaeota archaeon]